jgi:hypothetical protein
VAAPRGGQRLVDLPDQRQDGIADVAGLLPEQLGVDVVQGGCRDDGRRVLPRQHTELALRGRQRRLHPQPRVDRRLGGQQAPGGLVAVEPDQHLEAWGQHHTSKSIDCLEGYAPSARTDQPQRADQPQPVGTDRPRSAQTLQHLCGP